MIVANLEYRLCDNASVTKARDLQTLCNAASQTLYFQLLMGKSIPNTPSRRSQRFQPTATPTSKGIDQNILECEWASKAYYIRRTVPGSDLLPEEQQEGDVDDTDGLEESELSEMETIFYDAFRMKRKATAYRGSKRMKLGKTETQTYRVGDTVMVETDSLYIMKRPPSIGVLVAMWEVRRKAEGLHAPTDTNKMYLRIHWFLRPTELASIRAKREHEEVRLWLKFRKNFNDRNLE